MTKRTAIDTAHAEMQAAPDDDAKRLRFYERVADSELILALAEEAQGDRLSPMVFPVEGEQIVLAFDREDRLTGFLGEAAPYAALPGRKLVQMIAEQGAGLGLNLEVAPSSIVLPHSAMAWLADTLSNRPREMEATPTEILPPVSLPESVIAALDSKLAQAVGLAKMAYLVQAKYEGGISAPLLAFVDCAPGAEGVLADAAQEALTFAGIEAGTMDVAFFTASDALAAALARHGLRFDLPTPAKPQTPSAPGMDPSTPPKLT